MMREIKSLTRKRLIDLFHRFNQLETCRQYVKVERRSVRKIFEALEHLRLLEAIIAHDESRSMCKRDMKVDVTQNGCWKINFISFTCINQYICFPRSNIVTSDAYVVKKDLRSIDYGLHIYTNYSIFLTTQYEVTS
ncbi:unnamed protein product [Lactuca saligna]|uniref:Uncharacterized protein n=1 Tax=Lactuca saligna TaxID=75948 RepID=A0AA36EFP8_LACSI|nr:unnamed protein product [Lactuca saligna]